MKAMKASLWLTREQIAEIVDTFKEYVRDKPRHDLLYASASLS